MQFIPDRDRQERRYKFVVITETDAERRPEAPKRREYWEAYRKGQILVCEVDLDGGGIPIEVGTWSKPGKENCTYETFDLWTEAVNFSYAVADGRVDDKGREVRIRQTKRHGKKRSLGK